MYTLSYFFRIISTKEELKDIGKNIQTIVLDDFDFTYIELSEMIRILDRDRREKVFVCKYDNAIIYNYQQIIIICNKIPDIIFNSEACISRLSIVNITDDLRTIDSCHMRTTSRGNHLLLPPKQNYFFEPWLNVDEECFLSESSNESDNEFDVRVNNEYLRYCLF